MKKMAACLLLAGCAAPSPTIDDVRANRNDSFCARYPVTLEQAREILRAVFRWESARDVREMDDFVYADLGGEAVGAWTRVHEDGVIVTVTTVGEPRVTKEMIHARFRQGLKLAAAGRPLPDAPPGD